MNDQRSLSGALPGGTTLGQLVAELGGELLGPPDQSIERVAPLDAADPGCISFLAHVKYRARLQSTRAGCVIVSPAVRDSSPTRSSWAPPPSAVADADVSRHA